MSNGGSWNPKLTLKVNSFWIKIKGENFARQVLSRHTFKTSRKIGSDFFLSQGHFKSLHEVENNYSCYSSLVFRSLWCIKSSDLRAESFNSYLPCSSWSIISFHNIAVLIISCFKFWLVLLRLNPDFSNPHFFEPPDNSNQTRFPVQSWWMLKFYPRFLQNSPFLSPLEIRRIGIPLYFLEYIHSGGGVQLWARITY